MAAYELELSTLRQDANLVGYWRAEGNSNDEKGSNNGSDTSITYNTSNGKFNQGAGLNGTSSKITIGTAAAFNLTNNFTISLWVKSTANGAYQGIVGRAKESGAPDVYGGYAVAKEADNKFKFIMFYNNSFAAAVSDAAYTDTNWHHIVAVRDTGVATIYIDGTAQATTTSTAPDSVTGINLIFGRYYTATDNYYFAGAIDDIAIFNRALSSTEISDLYNGTGTTTSTSTSTSTTSTSTSTTSTSSSTSTTSTSSSTSTSTTSTSTSITTSTSTTSTSSSSSSSTSSSTSTTSTSSSTSTSTTSTSSSSSTSTTSTSTSTTSTSSSTSSSTTSTSSSSSSSTSTTSTSSSTTTTTSTSTTVSVTTSTSTTSTSTSTTSTSTTTSSSTSTSTSTTISLTTSTSSSSSTSSSTTMTLPFEFSVVHGDI